MNHFTLQELKKSVTADKLGINNNIPLSIIPNIEILINQVLNPIAEYMDKPIFVNSGYRCPMLNKAVGGVAGSQHVLGQAADITTKSRENDLIMERYIEENLTFDQMIVYKNFIHISYKAIGNRHQIIYKAK